jgi:tetratricopeptide (TPR) repeat protein
MKIKPGSYVAIKDYPSALKYYDLAEEQYMLLDSKVDIYYIHSGKGEVYLEAGEATNALLQLQAALRYANDMNDRNLQYDVMKRIAEIYRQRGDYKSAWQMLMESDRIKDSIFTLEKQNELLRVQTQFETEKKEKENMLLKARNETGLLPSCSATNFFFLLRL